MGQNHGCRGGGKMGFGEIIEINWSKAFDWMKNWSNGELIEL